MRYRALIGINYIPPDGAAEKRLEPGDLTDDLPLPPAGIAKWVRRGWIEAVAELPTPTELPAGGED